MKIKKRKVKMSDDEAPRYAVINMDNSIYTREEAEKEIRALYLEDPTKLYALAKIVAMPRFEMTLNFLDEEKKPRKPRTPKERSIGMGSLSFDTPPNGLTVAPSSFDPNISVANHPNDGVKLSGFTPQPIGTVQHRCIYCDRPATLELEGTDSIVRYICDEHD